MAIRKWPGLTRRKFLGDVAAACGGAAFAGESVSVGIRTEKGPAGERRSAQSQQSIDRVKLMPNLPEPYEMRDWRKVAQDYDAFVFDFNAKGKFLPVIAWDGHRVNYHGRSFSIVSYVGYDPHKTGGEAINTLAAVVGATLAGIDKNNQNGQNFVAMCQKWFSSDNGQDVYLNTEGWITGRTFWYELLPNVLFYQLNDLYPGTGAMPEQMITVADRYYEACVTMGGRTEPWRVPDFNHLSFSFEKMKATDNGRWREPDSAAAIAWLEYMAWVRTKNPKYLNAAKWGMGFLQRIDYNPFYEILLPYGAYLAARMNAEQGRNYDVGKLLNWCFDGNARYRRGWGVLAERVDGIDLSGLLGSTTDGGGYGFAMNTFQSAGALVPLVRYDTRFARDIGKWMLNLTSAARFFYSNALDEKRQSNFGWASEYDQNAAISYEGIRKWKRGFSTALSDYKTVYGRIVSGNFSSTHYREEVPGRSEVLEEVRAGDELRLEHIWDFDVPDIERRWLVVSAHGVGDGRQDRNFEFSYASRADGPYTPAFTVPFSVSNSVHFTELPSDIKGNAFIKVENTRQPPSAREPGRLGVDAIQITYQSHTGPFAQGDTIVSFVALIDRYTVPIVLYRPQSAVTGLALYGGSHVGILGGLVRKTNVEKILQFDLLKTDYYHENAYPTYLYYNPYQTEKTVEIDVRLKPQDLYDAVSHQFLKKSASGVTGFKIPGDCAVAIVLTPTGGEITRMAGKTLVNGVVIDYK